MGATGWTAISDKTKLIGGTDGTEIGNIGDRIKVDTIITSINDQFPNEVDVSKLLCISYGASLTVPAFPTIKPLGHYIVPAGHTYRLFGVMFKTNSAANYVHLYTKTILWNFGAVALGTSPNPTLLAKTISGSGLTTTTTYRYKIVAYNMIGNSTASSEISITLTGGQNAVYLSWSNLSRALYYEIYRTFANGVSNSQKLCGSTDQLNFTDILADGDLDAATVPSATSTSGNIDVGAYPNNFGASQVVVDTMSPISTVTPLDIIYRNIYDEKTYVSVTPGSSAGSQVIIQVKGLSNPLDNKRIRNGTPGNAKKRIYDVAIKDILSVGNNPATGAYVIYGHNHFYHMTSQSSNKWDTQYFESSFVFPGESEINFGVSGNSASTTATRHDVVLIGQLEAN